MKKFLLLITSFISQFSFAQSGITWNMGMNIAASSFGKMHPRIVTDGAENPVVIFGRMSDQSVFISRWNGIAFTTPMQINPVSLTIATMSWQGPHIAAKGDTMYVVMKQTPEADTSSHIYIQSSFDGGVTFSMPTQVDNIGDSISRFPTVTIDDNGNPIVAFMKMNGMFMDARWVVARSSDFGNTFSLDQQASGWSGGWVCDCCPGAIACNGSNVLMVYRDNFNDLRDQWAGISTDNGNSFTMGMPIDQNNWMISSCPGSGPDAVIIGDTVYTVYMSSATGSTRAYYSAASISAMQGTVGSEITGNFAGLSTQNYPRIATDGTAMALAWRQHVSGVDQCALLFTNDIANGFPASYDTVDLDQVVNVDVAVTNGNIFVVWEDDNSNTVKFRSGTFNSTVGLNENRYDSQFDIFPNPASESVSVRIKTVSEINSITVTDLLGQVIYTDKILLEGTTISNTSGWKNGIYFITINSSASVSTQKLIIQHQ